MAAQKITHNLSKTRTYNIWAVMKARCNNDNPNYGGRGITYDKRWGVFDAFYADMGLAPEGMSIERLNNNMGYSKTNCIWADVQTQARNKRTAQLDYFGACIILTLKKYGKSYKVIAEQLGTHISNVKDVVASRTWKDAVPLPM